MEDPEFKDRCQQFLELARTQYEKCDNWIDFHNALFGISAPFGRLFPEQEDRNRFEPTEENQLIRKMTRSLRASVSEQPVPELEPEQILLKLGPQLWNQLKVESAEKGLPLSLLCRAKLQQPLLKIKLL